MQSDNQSTIVGGGKRIAFVDVLKGFTIFLVAYMHCLESVKGQYFGEPDIMEDKLFAFVLSFHMPVFMMLSGFFAGSLKKQSIAYLLKRRFIPILLPMILWTGLSSIWHPTWRSNFLWGEYWFLNCILVIYILFFFIRYIPERFEAIFCLFLCAITMVISKFSYAHVNSMMPFFFLGFFLKKNYSEIKKKSVYICGISFVVFCVMSFYWDIQWTIYLTPIQLLQNSLEDIIHIIYRLIIGTSGALFLFTFFDLFYDRIKGLKLTKWLEWMGKYTLAIYIIHYFFYWVYLLPSCATGVFFFDDFIITPLYTIVLVLVCTLIIKIVRRNKYIAFAVIGERL